MFRQILTSLVLCSPRASGSLLDIPGLLREPDEPLWPHQLREARPPTTGLLVLGLLGALVLLWGAMADRPGILRILLGGALLLRLPTAHALSVLYAAVRTNRCHLRLADGLLRTWYAPWGEPWPQEIPTTSIRSLWAEGRELLALIAPDTTGAPALPRVLGSGPRGVLERVAAALNDELCLAGRVPAPSLADHAPERARLHCPACGAEGAFDPARLEHVCPQCGSRFLWRAPEHPRAPDLSTRALLRERADGLEIRVDHAREATFAARNLFAWERVRSRWWMLGKTAAAAYFALAAGSATLAARVVSDVFRTPIPLWIVGSAATTACGAAILRLLRRRDGSAWSDDSADYWNSVTFLVADPTGWSVRRESRGRPSIALLRIESPTDSDLPRLFEAMRIADPVLRAHLAPRLLGEAQKTR